MKKTFLTVLAIFGLALATTINAQVVPSVSAGSPHTITLPTNTTTLAGSAVSAGGAISSYAWTKVSGGAATIVSPTLATTTVNDLVQGVYTFRLTATDVASASAFADVVITVNPAPSLDPLVSAGSPQTIVLPISSVNLLGSATASTGRSITSQAWTQISGPASSVISSPSTLTTVVSGLSVAGTYVFKLTATDNTGASSFGTVSITVNTVVTPVPQKTKMQLEINPNGKVNLQGTILSNAAGVITVKVWGITFNINTAKTRFIGRSANISEFLVGDTIRVNGSIDTNAQTPTINAKLIRNASAQTRFEKWQKDNEDRDDDKNRGKNGKDKSGRDRDDD